MISVTDRKLATESSNFSTGAEAELDLHATGTLLTTFQVSSFCYDVAAKFC